MKKISFLLISIFLLCSTLSAAISQPAATVYLIRNEVISQDEMNSLVQSYNQAGREVTAQEVLEALISQRLFLQGAERDGYSVSQREVDSVYQQQKSTIENQSGKTLTDKEFEDMVIQLYGSVDSFKTQIKNSLTMEKYLPAKKGDMISQVEPPTDRDIRAWYRQNQTNFTQPEMLNVSVITMERDLENPSEDAKVLANIQKVYEDIKSGKITFEKGVQQYSQDDESKSKGGVVGWLSDNVVSRQNVGDEFVDTVMDMDVGEISSVIRTPEDYVIARVNSIMNAKILTLDDQVSPEENMTVRDFIKQGLTLQNSQLALAKAYDSLIDELKTQARINRIYK